MYCASDAANVYMEKYFTLTQIRVKFDLGDQESIEGADCFESLTISTCRFANAKMT
jgi:hypothetical protein